MTVPVLAIDPGADGGAVLLDASGRRARAAWGWRERQPPHEGYLLRRALPRATVQPSPSSMPPPLVLPDLAAVGETIRADLAGGYRAPERWRLVVEALFLPWPTEEDLVDREAIKRYLGRSARILALAESAALVYGPLLAGAVEVRRVYASQWRWAVLELQPDTPADDAQDEAVRRVGEGLVVGLGLLREDGHVCEAACMARWRWEIENPAQQSLLGGAK